MRIPGGGFFGVKYFIVFRIRSSHAAFGIVAPLFQPFPMPRLPNLSNTSQSTLPSPTLELHLSC